MQNEPTTPQAELREHIEKALHVDWAFKNKNTKPDKIVILGYPKECGYYLSYEDFVGRVVELLTTERERALKEYEDRDIEVELNTKQCLEVAQTVYEKYQEAMQPPAYAFYQFPDWLSRQLEALKKAPDAK